MKYSKDGKVSFDPENHVYTLGDKKLKSITTLINEHKTPFDTDLIAGKYALKHGLDKDEVIEKWRIDGEESRKRGTACHQKIENFILNGVEIIPENQCEQSAKDFVNDFLLTFRLFPVEVEHIVYNDNYAGQVDLIAKNKEGEFFILDWKTNKSIDIHNHWQNMTNGLEKWSDCNYNHYSLQLNCYKKMSDYPIKECYIVHLNEGYKLYKTNNINLL